MNEKEALKGLFDMIPMQDMRGLQEIIKTMTLLSSLLPPIEVREVQRKEIDPKTKAETVKKYVAIYIEKPQKEAKP
jgi:hypothetical protein